jgi:hypothetical protein
MHSGAFGSDIARRASSRRVLYLPKKFDRWRWRSAGPCRGLVKSIIGAPAQIWRPSVDVLPPLTVVVAQGAIQRSRRPRIDYQPIPRLRSVGRPDPIFKRDGATSTIPPTPTATAGALPHLRRHAHHAFRPSRSSRGRLCKLYGRPYPPVAGRQRSIFLAARWAARLARHTRALDCLVVPLVPAAAFASLATGARGPAARAAAVAART